MLPLTDSTPVLTVEETTASPIPQALRWRLATRVAFRFSFVYFGQTYSTCAVCTNARGTPSPSSRLNR